MRWRISFCSLLLLVGNACLALEAQQTSTNGDVFAGQDPLEVRAEVMPAPSSGGCVPPGNFNWKVVARQGGTCYYVAPFPTRLNGYVADINDVGAIERLGGRCGDDEFDHTKAVCFNNGDDLPGAPPTTGLPAGIGSAPPNGPASGGPGGNNNNRQPAGSRTNGGPNGSRTNRGGPTNGRGGPGFNDTPRIPGPAGGIGYKPGADPCLPKGPGGYDYCQNPTGTRLPPGCYCDGPPPPGATGGKTIKRGPGPSQPAPPPPPPPTPPPPPNLLVIQKAMNDCLSLKLPYWVATNVQSQYMQAARNSASASVRSTPPERLPYQTQVFMVETAMALQAQAFHDRKYGQGKYDPTDPHDPFNPAYTPSYLAGWFDRCLATSGLQPLVDHRIPYGEFLGGGTKDNRVLAFGSGYVYGDLLAPVTMLPPYVPAP